MAVGDACPIFTERSSNSPALKIDTIAGRWLVLTFIGGMADPKAAAVVPLLAASPEFDDDHASLFFVTADPADETSAHLPLRFPGVRAYWDFERAVAKELEVGPDGLTTVLISPRLQIAALIHEPDPARHAETVLRRLAELPSVEAMPPMLAHAPVLIIPDLFEPAFCRTLIDGYRKNGGKESGFMREIDGKTVEVRDKSHKVRRDWTVEDQKTVQSIQTRFKRRIIPEIKKSFQFDVSRMERYLVDC